MDSSGVAQVANYYVLNDISCQNISGAVVRLQNGDVICWGRDSFFALRADSNLAHVWSKRFQGHGGVSFIKELPGGDLLAGINLEGAGASVMRMDAGGNMQWCKSYMHPKGVVYDCVVESDSSFYVTGYTDSIPAYQPGGASFHPDLFLLKLNGTGDVQWCKGYNSDYDWVTDRPIKMIRAHDGSNVLLATIGQFGRHPFLMKLDANGDTLWTRMVGPLGYGNDMSSADLIETSDGGLLFDCMQMFLGVFLYKTDSMGHFSCLELTPPPLTSTALFPSDSSYSIPSVDGAVAYPVVVANAPCDTVIFTEDGCFFTAVNHPEAVGRLRVHPNPNTGHFTVAFTDALSADSFYSVYDAVGKLLFQRPLGKGITSEEIDLSRFGKGTYLVRVTGKDGVCNERVVVQ